VPTQRYGIKSLIEYTEKALKELDEVKTISIDDGIDPSIEPSTASHSVLVSNAVSSSSVKPHNKPENNSTTSRSSLLGTYSDDRNNQSNDDYNNVPYLLK
jgi:hypothetical protein